MKRMTEISQSENKDQHAAIPTETKVQQSSISRKNHAKQKGKESTTKDRNLNKKIGTTNDKKKQNSNQNLVCTDRNSLHEAHFFLIKAYVENNPVVVKEN